MDGHALHVAVIESLRATASELHARAHEDMNDDWADRMAEALAAAGLLAAPAAQGGLTAPIPPEVRRVVDGHGCIYDATDDPEMWRHAAHGDGALAGAPISTGDLLVHGVFEVPAAVVASPAAPADDEGDIERMAAAMAIGDGYEPDNEFVETYVARARAALAALREGQS